MERDDAAGPGRHAAVRGLLLRSGLCVACGGGARLGGGKQGAAQALFAAIQPANKAGQMNGQSLVQRLVSAADSNTTGEITVNCAKGGSVTLKLDLLSIVGDEAERENIKYDLEYDDCNEDGSNEFNGKMAMEINLAADDTSAGLSITYKGKIEISGEIDDYIDADVTQAITIMVPDETTGSVSISLTGTIKTSEETYTYDGTPITITVEGQLPADDGNS